MATVTEQEKNNQIRLKEQRAKADIESDDSGITPASIITVAEFVLVFGAAITLDLIDILDFTGVGAILVRFIDIPTLGFIWLWRILKQQKGPKKDPTLKLLSAFLVEISPIGLIPSWSIFVIYVFFQDTKVGKKTISKAKKIKTKK
ncbi:MAG: hypothetical protein GF387_02850 [Candidatus Portnoybacteria bacterium]|nr:hypothetical protein [Candidatus Portnoybacteria bacterium]